MADSKSFYEVLTIESNDQKRTVNLIPGALKFEYYEDIFSPTITAKLTVLNTGNTVEGQSLYNGLPLRGGERLSLKVLPNSSNVSSSLDFSKNGKYLYVSSITDVVLKQKKEMFTLHLTSREAITNETTRVYKKYNSKISKSVNDIYEEFLKSNQKIQIDETSNDYKFIGNLRKPFTTLIWLASKAVPAEKNGIAGYVFFQTEEKFNFRSLDSLSSQEPRNKNNPYVYSQSYPSFDGTKKLDNDYQILNYYIDRNKNLIDDLRLGAYSSWRMFYNPLTFTVTIPDAGYYTSEQYKKNLKTLGGKQKFPKISTENSDNLGDVPTRIISKVLDIGTLNKNPKKDNNADPSEYQSQAVMRYNLLLTQSISIVIPCNLDLHAGDVIDCLFPKNDINFSNEYDEDISGLYIIKELCHSLDTEESYTSLRLIRDTFGKRKR